MHANNHKQILSAVRLQDGGHENLMKEYTKAISFNISKINCRGSNKQHAIAPIHITFIESSEIS